MRVGEQPVAHVVDHSAIDLFRHTPVEAPVASFQMHDGYPHPRRRESTQAAVGVAQYEQAIRARFGHDPRRLRDDLSYLGGGRFLSDAKVLIRRSQGELTEE